MGKKSAGPKLRITSGTEPVSGSDRVDLGRSLQISESDSEPPNLFPLGKRLTLVVFNIRYRIIESLLRRD